MASVEWIEHNGKRILYMNYAYSKYAEVSEAIEKTKQMTAKEPLSSVLGIVDVRGSPFNREISAALKDLAEHNKPYIKMSVVVGVEGIKKVIYQGVMKFTGRKNLILKDTLEEAKDFLAGL
ncbi:MAG TPA: hypothetical protein P5511_04820 [Candidatus Goldiibacteriota bacterium]|nr:hypothetical protein [Candidatus Goldiibacteriota bacterium]